MTNFLLNPLSAVEQCETMEQVYDLVSSLVDCFVHLSPALVEGRARLLVDERVHAKHLLKDTLLLASISTLVGKKARDVRTKWFLYTRQRGVQVNYVDSEINIKAYADSSIPPAVGIASEEIHAEDIFLLSLGGCSLNTATRLEITSPGRYRVANNAHELAKLLEVLPRFEAHKKKHRLEPYFDATRKEWVAAMTLPDDLAQQVLTAAIPYGGEYFGLHRPTGKFIRFLKTNDNVYHGFEVDESDVPNSVAKELKL